MRFGKIGPRKMMHRGPVLPLGARWVEYLKSDGNAIIDFGFPMNATLSLFATIGSDNIYSKSHIVGARISNTAAGAFSFSYERINSTYSNRWIGRNRNTNVITVTDVSPVEQFVDCVMTPTEFKIDDTVVESQRNSIADSENIKFSDGMIKSLMIQDGGVTTHNFRPIAIDNKGYMLDLVSGEYEQYGNQGTGEFVLGPTIAYPERERERERE